MNRKRWIINYMLLFGVVALGFLANTGDSPEPESTTGRGDISPLEAEQVMWLRIKQAGQPEALLERIGTTWQIREPTTLAADTPRVEQLLQLVDSPTHMHFLAEHETLEQYGLAAPSLRLYFNDVEFVFGTTNPLNHRRYMGVGEQVVQTDDRYFYQIANGWSALADRQLLPGIEQLTRLELPGQNITLNEGLWQNDSSPQLDAETLAITAELWLTSRAKKLRVTEHWRGAKVRIHYLQNGNSQQLDFRVERGNNGFWLHRLDSGLSYLLPQTLGHRLLYPAIPLSHPDTP